MTTLSRLRELSLQAKAENKRRELEAEAKKRITANEIFLDAVTDISERLEAEAKKGKTSMVVATFPTDMDMPIELWDKIHLSKNFYTAWGNTVFPSDVVNYRWGALKLTYDFLLKEKLNPQIRYWDGNEEDGFSIVVSWEKIFV